MHTISIKPEYLLVTFEGEVTSLVIHNAIAELLARDDYPNMNDIWCFDDCTISVSQYQLGNIVNDVLARYPHQCSRTKTALVASSGFTRAMTQTWAEQAEILPYSIQSFMSLKDAERWIA